MSTRWSAVVIGIGILLAAIPVLGHHSFSAEFDANSPVDMTGKVTNWGFEMGSPNQLVRSGWKRTTMKVGDVVSVEGSRARDQSDNANARVVILESTGERLFAGSSQSRGR